MNPEQRAAQLRVINGPDSVTMINERPRPRLLIRGFEDDPDLIQHIESLAPTCKVIKSLREVRQADWDALITDGPATIQGAGRPDQEAAPHLCIVYFSSTGSGYNLIEYRKGFSVNSQDGYICTSLKRLRDLPSRIAHLTREHLEPLMTRRESHTYFATSGGPSSFDASGAAPADSSFHIDPFILSADNYVLAGRYARSPTSESWLIPGDTPEYIAWIRAALAEWNALNPLCFPGLPDWSETDAWLTASERLVVSQLNSIDAERAHALEGFAKRETELKDQLRQARIDADAYERALLTAQSEPLVDAAMRALAEIGFIVTNADSTAAPGDYLEDLHVRDPDDPSWIAIAEVKGFTKGAQTAALSTFTRFNRRYHSRFSAFPDANWYIVNQFILRDPSDRQPVLHGSDADVNAFASNPGLIIDTIVLFRILMMVREQSIDAGIARASLRTSTGRLATP